MKNIYIALLTYFLLGIVPIYAQNYDADAAASYSDDWTCDKDWGVNACPDNFHNPAYWWYTNNDCANYVSQCLIAGGLDLSDGPGLDAWGCIPYCDNLHINLTTYQSATYVIKNSGYPTTNFSRGDVAIYGNSSDNWKHSTFNATNSTPELNAHTSNRYHRSPNYFYGTTLTLSYFYHIPSTSTNAINDDCSSSVVFPTLIPGDCVGVSSGETVAGATQSLPPNQCMGCNCISPSAMDVWFKFKAINTSHTIELSNMNDGFDGVIELRQGPSCNGTYLQCYDQVGQPSSINYQYNNFIPNTYYYIRVFDYGSNPPSDPTFDICISTPGNALPDLIITAGTQSASPLTVAAGSSITASASEDNIGNATAGSTKVGLWLSDDGTLQTNQDVHIGDITGFPSLAPGSCSNVLSSTVTIPVSTTAGTYYLFFWADGDEAVTESVENNNFASKIINVTCGVPAQPGTISGNSAVCQGSTNTYSINPVSGATSYIWTLPSGWSGNSSITSINATAGTNSGLIKVKAVNSCGSGPEQTKNVTVNTSLPVSVSISATANPVCVGTSVTFSAIPTNGGNNPSYQWKKNGQNVGTNSSSYTYIPNNNDIISCTLTSSLSCATNNPAVSNSITMQVNSGLPVSVTISASANPVCIGTQVTFIAVANNGGSSPSYQWLRNGQSVGSNNPTYSYTPANSDIITCILTSSLPCASGNPASSNSITMVVNAQLPVSISISASANPVCYGQSVNFIATPANGGTNPVYQWYKNGNPTGTNSPVFTYSPSNNDQVYCVLTSNSSCASNNPAASNLIVMSVTSSVQVGISISASANPVCVGTSVTYTAIPTNGGNNPLYQWKKNGQNVGSNSPSFSYQPSNNDVITCVLTSNSPCATGNPATSNPITMSVSSNLPAGVTITASSNPSCSGSPVTFIANPENGGSNPFYQWKLNGTNVGSNNPVFIHYPANNDIISCIMTSSSSCATSNPATSNAIQMSIEYQMPVVSFYTYDNYGPTPFTVQFYDNSLNNPTTWLWDFGDGYTSSDQNPIHVYNNIGVYSVTLQVGNSCGTDLVSYFDYIQVIDPALLPVVQFTANPISGYNPLNVTFTNQSSANSTYFSWSFGDDTYSNEVNPTHEYLEAGTYTVSLYASNTYGSDYEEKTDFIQAVYPPYALLYLPTDSVNIGAHYANSPIQGSFKINNIGGTTLSGTISEQVPWISDVSPQVINLEAGEETTIAFTGTFPLALAPFSGIINISTNAGNANVNVFGVTSLYDWKWAEAQGGKNRTNAKDICTDKSGNSYCVGSFGDTAIFGDVTLISDENNYSSMYFAKYDQNGDITWIKQVNNALPSSIAIDTINNSLYISGYYYDTANFDGIKLTTQHENITNLFIAKYSLSGNIAWVKKFGDSTSCQVCDLSLNSNNVFLIGSFWNHLVLGNTTLSASGSNNFNYFISKLDLDGNPIWAKSIINEYYNHLTFESEANISSDIFGNLYIFGTFEGTAYFPPLSFNALSSYDFYIVRYDAYGNVVWGTSSNGHAWPGDLCCDKEGNLFVGGTISSGTVNIGGQVIDVGNTSKPIIIKYNSSNQLQWIKTGNAPTGAGIQGICLDKDDNIFITGGFIGELDFGNYPLSGGTVFVTKFDINGDELFSTQSISDNSSGYGGGGSGKKISSPSADVCNVLGRFNGFLSFYTFDIFGEWGPGENGFIAKIGPESSNVGLNPIAISQNAIIYPNPNSGSFTIKYKTEKVGEQFVIYNAAGVAVLSADIDQGVNEHHFKESGLSNGIYIWKIVSGSNEQISSGKMVIIK